MSHLNWEGTRKFEPITAPQIKLIAKLREEVAEPPLPSQDYHSIWASNEIDRLLRKTGRKKPVERKRRRKTLTVAERQPRMTRAERMRGGWQG